MPISKRPFGRTTLLKDGQSKNALAPMHFNLLSLSNETEAKQGQPKKHRCPINCTVFGISIAPKAVSQKACIAMIRKLLSFSSITLCSDRHSSKQLLAITTTLLGIFISVKPERKKAKALSAKILQSFANKTDRQ
jgi:hypothetical protein